MIGMALLLASAAAKAQGIHDPSPSITACSVPEQVQIVSGIEGLPSSIQADLKGLMPDIAPRDAKFQRYDHIREENLATRRFISALFAKNMWVVLYEDGPENRVHAVRFDILGRTQRFATFPGSHLVGEICPLITASFAGISSTNPGQY